MKIRAVLFDLGGVVLDSPLHFLAEYEKRHGLPASFVARLVGGYGAAQGSWQRLERGELSIAEFCEQFDRDLRAEGVEISSARMMREMAERGAVRPVMLDAIRKLRRAGLKTAALTNNWATDEQYDARLEPLRQEFDVFVESCKLGMRKPEPRIYEYTLNALAVPAEQAVFLDDIGGNLKVARALGMTTIKVQTAETALTELERLVDVPLTS